MKMLLETCLLIFSLGPPVSAQTPKGGGINPAGAPAPVTLVAEKAEDVIDPFLARNWSESRGAVDAISASEPAVLDTMQKAGLPLSAMDTFSYFVFRIKTLQAEGKDPVGAALAANQITAILIDLEVRFSHPMPMELSWMDYLGREILLWSQVPDATSLTRRRVSQLDASWAALKPLVQKRNGEKAALRVDDTLAAMRTGASPSRLGAEARRILDLVDELEKLFQ